MNQEARPYALIAPLAALNLVCVFRIFEHPDRVGRLAGWAASCVLLLYSQYLAGLIVVAEVIFLVVALPGYYRRFPAVGALSVMSVAPWFLAARQDDGWMLHEIDWIGAPAYIDFAWYYVGIFGDVVRLPAMTLVLLLGPISA